MKVIISGGGIAGLTAALCCLHYKHEVIVLEKSPELGEIGAGIQVPPNAMKVFEKLGLESAFEEYAFEPVAIEGRLGLSGMHLFSVPLADTAVSRWGSRYLHIHRADYISLLEKALRKKVPDVVRLNQEVVGYSQNNDSVCAKLRDGSEVWGDVLIGADGIHSPIRIKMLGDEKAKFTGNVAWRAVVPMERLGKEIPDPTACGWMGRGAHAVTYRLRCGKLANLVAVVERDDWVSESWTEQGTIDEALSDFKGWHPIILNIIRNSDAIYRWALFDRPPLKSWVDGRVAIIGDAAHPMLPFMAQGAAMAVEDAWVVTERLTRFQTVNEALKSYQNIRFERASGVQAGSRANAKTFHQRSTWGRLKTYGPMWLAGKLAPTAIHARLDNLYGYDVTSV